MGVLPTTGGVNGPSLRTRLGGKHLKKKEISKLGGHVRGETGTANFSKNMRDFGLFQPQPHLRGREGGLL